MITEKDFFNDFDGHNDAYSTYMLIDVKPEDIINVLNEIDPDMCVGSGVISETARSVSFEICNKSPEFIQKITEKLHCTGFADTGSWNDAPHFVAYKNGEEYNNFTAEWTDDGPSKNCYDTFDEEYDEEYETDETYEEFCKRIPDEDAFWDIDILITDNETGETYHCGEGLLEYDDCLYFRDLVEKHSA